TNWPIDEKTKTVNIFANTKINLFEEVTDAKKDAQFNGNPLFRVYNLSNGLMTVSVYVDGEELKGTSTYKFTEVGAEHKVEFKCGDESIACWNNIRVVPNLVMKAKEDVTLYSDSSFGFADLFTLKQYRTDLTYGSKSGNTIIMYTDENLADGEVETYEGLVIKTEEDSLIDKATKQVGWIEEIDDSYGKAEKLTIGYYDTDIEFGSVDVTIKNQYTEQGHLEITEISTILAKVATDSFVKYNNSSYGVLKSIETNEENLKFEINASGEFVVTDVDGRNINTKYTPNYFLFTFYNGEASSNKLTYKFFNNSQNPIAILPYTPAFVEETPAVTLQYYGLIKDVLDLSTLDTNNVESILVTGASDTTAFVENFDSKIKNHGYTASTPSE
ncbi:MAG: hypothetical protein MJ152_04680, partial [Clostridia bacterium]|nr:hypothetical protein [Clostridia bacterium]